MGFCLDGTLQERGPCWLGLFTDDGAHGAGACHALLVEAEFRHRGQPGHHACTCPLNRQGTAAAAHPHAYFSKDCSSTASCYCSIHGAARHTYRHTQRTHVQTQMRANTHRRAHARTHAYVQTHIHTHAHIYKRPNVQVHTRARTHTYTHTHAQMHMHARVARVMGFADLILTCQSNPYL